MYDVQSELNKDSAEYNEICYRIMCGQSFQQATIDAFKGIEVKPMPKYWYERCAALKMDEQNGGHMNSDIVANRKPYFMNYRYKKQSAEYNSYMKSARFKCEMEFGKSLEELLRSSDRTDDEESFVMWYKKMLPVSDGDCVMNRLCHMVEKKLTNCKDAWKEQSGTFNYTIYRTDAKYDTHTFNLVSQKVEGAMKEYKSMLRAKQQDGSPSVISECRDRIMRNAARECYELCNNEEELCNIVLDYTYGRGCLHQVAWGMIGDLIVKKMIERNGNKVRYYVKSDNGDVNYKGMTFEERVCDMGELNVNDSE